MMHRVAICQVLQICRVLIDGASDLFLCGSATLDWQIAYSWRNLRWVRRSWPFEKLLEVLNPPLILPFIICYYSPIFLPYWSLWLGKLSF
ncbi:hypothetical protein DPMN_061309 [Dreissena polymorpha]|uniref:Uncharacterized protein n=1 Tax=Dreissena polymorpha TaxID=45954 RepID=A0A9D4HIA3_DREPO|nr:hypothetical protein DPMN_061309 [Dreissena polymorpha]